MKKNLTYLFLGVLFIFSVCRYVVIDYKKFEYGLGYNLCKRSLPYSVKPVYYFLDDSDQLELYLACNYTETAINLGQYNPSKDYYNSEFVGYGYSDSIIIIMTTDTLNEVHYDVSESSNYYTLDGKNGVHLKTISETEFLQLKSTCRWIYVDINKANILASNGGFWCLVAVCSLLLLIKLWFKNKHSKNKFREDKLLDNPNLTNFFLVLKKITIHLPRVICVLSLCVLAFMNFIVFECSLKDIFIRLPDIDSGIGLYSDSFYFKAKDGEPILGEGNHYYRCDFKIKTILEYRFNDTTLIIKYVDNLDSIHYLSSYIVQPVTDNGKPILSFFKISEHTYQDIKASSYDLGFDLEGKMGTKCDAICTSIVGVSVFSSIVSLFFWLILLEKKRMKTYCIIFISMMLIYAWLINLGFS